MTTASQDKYDAEMRDIGKEICELEARAGIAADAKNAREDSFFPLHVLSDTPLFTEASFREGEEEFARERSTITRKIRRLYFSIPDIELRKLLIEKDRAYTNAHRNWFVASRDDAQQALTRAHSVRRHWWVSAAFYGVLLVLGGYFFFKIPGALAGVVAAIFLGRGIEEKARQTRDKAIKSAQENLSSAGKNAEDMLSRAYTFTRRETFTGTSEENPTRFRRS